MSGERLTTDNAADRQPIDAVDQQFAPVDPAEIDEVTKNPEVVRNYNPGDTPATLDREGNLVFKPVEERNPNGGYL